MKSNIIFLAIGGDIIQRLQELDAELYGFMQAIYMQENPNATKSRAETEVLLRFFKWICMCRWHNYAQHILNTCLLALPLQKRACSYGTNFLWQDSKIYSSNFL